MSTATLHFGASRIFPKLLETNAIANFSRSPEVVELPGHVFIVNKTRRSNPCPRLMPQRALKQDERERGAQCALGS